MMMTDSKSKSDHSRYKELRTMMANHILVNGVTHSKSVKLHDAMKDIVIREVRLYFMTCPVNEMLEYVHLEKKSRNQVYFLQECLAMEIYKDLKTEIKNELATGN
jgi:hypothetical protein